MGGFVFYGRQGRFVVFDVLEILKVLKVFKVLKRSIKHALRKCRFFFSAVFIFHAKQERLNFRWGNSIF